MNWSELGPIMISSAATVITALTAALIAILNAVKAKASLKEKLAEAETANAELRKAIIESAYIICPQCGTKILLKDQKIYYTKEDN